MNQDGMILFPLLDRIACPRSFLTNDLRDSWESTRKGLNTVVLLKGDYSKRALDVRRCFLWSADLKLVFDPNYVPSDLDAKRPQWMYRDSFARDHGPGSDWFNLIMDLWLSLTFQVGRYGA